MRILQIVHEHRVSMVVEDVGPAERFDEGLTLDQLATFLGEALVEGAPEGAITAFDTRRATTSPQPEDMIIAWRDEREPGETPVRLAGPVDGVVLDRLVLRTVREHFERLEEARGPAPTVHRGPVVNVDSATGKRCTCGQDLDGTLIGREHCPTHGQTTTNHPDDERPF